MASAQPQAQAGWQEEGHRADAARTLRLAGEWHGASYQDVLDAPENKIAQVVNGKFYLLPRPAGPHTTAGSSLGMELGPPYHKQRGGPGGWWILNEPELHFGKDPDTEILVPDVAGWRRTRMPDSPRAAFVTLVPDWVCEILSPSTRKLDLTHKRDIYAREGVPYLWFLDPGPPTLDAFELRKGQWQQIASLARDDLVSVPPFEEASFPLNSLWF